MSTDYERAYEALAKLGTTPQMVTDRILSVWKQATPTNIEDGAQWYLLRQQEVYEYAETYAVTPEYVATLIAHLSPRTPWDRNIKGARSVLRGQPIAGLIPANLARAVAAGHTTDPLSTLKGKKTRSFALNMLGDLYEVTIDVWAARVALGACSDLENRLKRVGVYEALAYCYRDAAQRVGVTPPTMQATTWIVARNGRAT